MAVVESVKTLSIIPLNEKNFATWKIQVKMALMRENLWGIVNGAEALPIGANNDENRRKFVLRRDRALSTIVISIEPKLLYIIGDPSDPRLVYQKLENFFQKKTWSNKLRLRKKLYSAKLKAGDTMHGHLRNLIDIFDKLAVMDDAVSEEDRVIHLLASLPDKYSTLVTALEAQENVPSWETVSEKLLHEEQKQTTHVNEETAFFGKPKFSKSSKFSKSERKCFECGKSGHIKKNCRVYLRKLRSSQNFNANVASNDSTNKDESDMDNCGLLTSSLSASEGIDHNWIVDSGATRNMCNNKDYFDKLVELNNPIRIKLGDGREVCAVAIGTVTLEVNLPDRRVESFLLRNVLYVPSLAYNLISVAQLDKEGKHTVFSNNSCRICCSDKVIAVATKLGELYSLETALSVGTANYSTANLWHKRFCHLNEQSLKKIFSHGIVDGINCDKFNDLSFCESCVQGKNHRLPFPKKTERRSTKILEVIHSDVCGKISTPSLSNCNYFVTFIDDSSRYVWIYFLQTKDQVFEKFKEFKIFVEKQTGAEIKTLRTDNGGEYTSREFENFLSSNGIKHEKTVPKTPEQNGISERMNRSLVESVRTMLHDADLPRKFWAEALSTAAYVKNRSPSSVLQGNKTPYEVFNKRKPNVNYFRSFGCEAYAHIPKDDRKKLDQKSLKCIFLGYGKFVKGYRLFDVEKEKIIFSRDVVFNESSFSLQKESLQSPTRAYVELPITDSLGEIDSTVPLRRSQRTIKPPERLGDWTTLATNEGKEPNSYQEALTDSNAKLWREAMAAEMSSMQDNKVWKLVKLPEGRSAVACRWIYKKKTDSNGRVSRYKARLVAKGFSQKPGVDYDETFSPVARFESVRTIMAIGVQQGHHIHQMDVTAAFLNGELHEEVYMAQPEGYEVKGKENLVCKLNKSIYGLKQSPRCWNASLHSYLVENKFVQSSSDPCIYTHSEGELLILALYVDDIILSSKSLDKITAVKSLLQKRYKMSDMGKLNYFLGVKIDQSIARDSIFMSQQAYSERLVQNFGLSDAKPAKTPMEPNFNFSTEKDNEVFVDSQKYQSAVGSLLYLSTKTRPDLSYAVGKVARYCAKPASEHWVAVKRILRYVKGTTNYGLLYSKSNSSSCVGYSDADWAGDASDRKSTSGYSFQLSGASVSWNSTKQTCVALSTAEAEYYALASAAQEAIWMQQLLKDLHYSYIQPMTVYEDNQATMCIAGDRQCSKKTKHIDIRFHFVRDLINSNKIVLKYCSSDQMIADILTKSLSAEKFCSGRDMLGVSTCTF